MSLIVSKILALYFVLLSFLPTPTFTEGMVGQPQKINPLEASTGSVDKDLSRLIFRGLMKYDLDGNLLTDLSEQYEISADFKEYTFGLRKNVLWHDGQEFNADDVLYTVSQHPQLRTVEVDKLDRYRVRFRLKDPYAPFLDLLTLGILPSHLGSKMEGLSPVGTGDYRFVRVKKSDKINEVVLMKVVKKEGEGAPPPVPAFSRLIFKFYGSSKDLLTAASLGEIDALSSDEYVPPITNFNQYRTPLGARYYALFINLNGRTSDLTNKELRQDMANSVPKEKIIEEVLKGAASPAYLPQEYTFATASGLKRYHYKDDLSRKYDIELKLTVPKKESHLKTAQILKEAFERIGLHLTLQEVESEKITTDVIKDKNFDLLLLGQEIERDPDVYTLWHSTQKDLPGLNFVSFESVLADKALEEGRKTRDQDERIRHYQNFQKVFIEEVPAIIIYRPNLTYAVKSSISNVSLQGLFGSDDRFATIGEWQRKN